MAVGNPFGLEQTVTTGIVSAKERVIGTGPYDDFVQTDAAINPGNSGGPLIDARGSVIGINTAIFSESGGSVGIGFATPINIAKQVLPQLRETGKVTRGFLGVVVGPVTTEGQGTEKAGARAGAPVMEVTRGGPASRAGVERGDIITGFQGQQIRDPRDLTRRVAGTPPGTTIPLQLTRNGQQRTVDVKLDELKETKGDRG
jgi:serine protease Do